MLQYDSECHIYWYLSVVLFSDYVVEKTGVLNVFLCSGLTLTDAPWHHCHANEAGPLGDQWFIRNMLARASQYCPLTPAYRAFVCESFTAQRSTLEQMWTERFKLLLLSHAKIIHRWVFIIDERLSVEIKSSVGGLLCKVTPISALTCA